MKKQATPKHRYNQHRLRAKNSGIEFALTFEQWWELWEPHWSKRGRGAQDMCMCRRHDKGGYTLGNVRIATTRENRHEAAMERKVSRSQKRYYRSREVRITAIGDQVGWAANRKAFDEYTEEDSA